ncbi:uncharacterized protein LOC135103515 [Scylla paramamosain]|uniref:uncharacterized protein LOC135103515 n=1 Tax=Scylla paramamosain TaxID=85552 RepID=UPI003083B975
MKQLVVHDDDARATRDFQQGKMAAIANTYSLWTITTRSCDYYIADTLFTTSTSSFSLAFPKGSKLKPIVDSILYRLMEGGITDHLLQSNFHEAKKCYKKLSITSNASLRSLELGDFYGIFSLFGGGVFASVVIFLMELCFHKLCLLGFFSTLSTQHPLYN